MQIASLQTCDQPGSELAISRCRNWLVPSSSGAEIAPGEPATVRGNVTIDWTLRENVRAQLRVLVKRILRRHGYPPDKQEKAETVLKQAAVLSADCVAE